MKVFDRESHEQGVGYKQAKGSWQGKDSHAVNQQAPGLPGVKAALRAHPHTATKHPAAALSVSPGTATEGAKARHCPVVLAARRRGCPQQGGHPVLGKGAKLGDVSGVTPFAHKTKGPNPLTGIPQVLGLKLSFYFMASYWHTDHWVAKF